MNKTESCLSSMCCHKERGRGLTLGFAVDDWPVGNLSCENFHEPASAKEKAHSIRSPCVIEANGDGYS